MASSTVQLLAHVKQLLLDVAAMAASRITYESSYRETITEVKTQVTCTYNPAQVYVYLNGMLLDYTDDYVATNGSTIEFQFSLEVGDRVVVQRVKIDNASTSAWQAALDLKQNKDVSTTGAVTTTATVSMSGPAYQLLTLGSPNCAITVTTAAVPAGEARIVNLLLKQGTGANNYTFGTTVNWVNDAAPVPSVDINTLDSIQLQWLPGLTKPIGFYRGGNISA